MELINGSLPHLTRRLLMGQGKSLVLIKVPHSARPFFLDEAICQVNYFSPKKGGNLKWKWSRPHFSQMQM